jgi:hypothetical protein
LVNKAVHVDDLPVKQQAQQAEHPVTAHTKQAPHMEDGTACSLRLFFGLMLSTIATTAAQQHQPSAPPPADMLAACQQANTQAS